MIDKSNLKKVENKEPISVVIPSYGRREYLSRCVESLLGQTILPDEIIVIDNSPSELQSELIKSVINDINSSNLKTSVKYAREKQSGIGAARNKGIKVAGNELLAFIDDDCVAKKDWFEKMVYAAESNPRILIQGSNRNGAPNNIFSCEEQYTTQSFFLSRLYKTSGDVYNSKLLDTKNCLLRKSLLPQYPYFDKRFLMLEDVDFSLSIARSGIKIMLDSEIVVWHFGRSDLISHMTREFNKGRNLYILYEKWQKKEREGKYIEIEELLRKIHNEKTKKVEERLKRKILKGKTSMFKFFFSLLFYLDKMVIWLGYLFEKLATVRSFTKIFLPLKTLTKIDRNQRGK